MKTNAFGGFRLEQQKEARRKKTWTQAGTVGSVAVRTVVVYNQDELVISMNENRETKPITRRKGEKNREIGESKKVERRVA